LIASITPDARTSAAWRLTNAATVPPEIGTPNSSDKASAVRFFDRNCPAYR
jgi:hypothetical protein